MLDVSKYDTAPSLSVVAAANVVDPSGTVNNVLGFHVSDGVAFATVNVTSVNPEL